MFHEYSVIEKFYGAEGGGGGVEKEGGSIKIFRQDFFVSVPEKFVGEHFSVSLIAGI